VHADPTHSHAGTSDSAALSDGLLLLLLLLLLLCGRC
jgi:hypothetical protein